MTTLSIDIETYSSYDLKSCGVYKYVQAPDFEILLFAYSVDYGPVEIVDLMNGEKLPREVNHALTDPSIIKITFNAQFERTCIARHFLKILNPQSWHCTMVKSAMLGLPMSLDQVGKVLHLDTQKDAAGKALIRYFSIPCKPTAANDMRTRNYPIDDPEKWEAFKRYCVRDVEVEMEISKALAWYQVPEQERELYILDQNINDKGIRLDPQLMENAIRIDEEVTHRMVVEAEALTGLDNPGSVVQLKDWIGRREALDIDSLSKDVIPELIALAEDPDVVRMLQLRAKMAKSSVKKYQAMMNCICTDQRAHGLVQYFGSRTGRWAGRLIQLHNLPRIYLPDIEVARQLVVDGNGELLELVYSNVPDTLSQLVRTAFVAKPDHRFIVADFSAIELIVIAWLAGERWVIEEYQGARKIYEATAARMLHVPVDSITKDSPARQKGKIASLACQYQGAVGALIQMGAVRMGLKEEELPEIIHRWRAANPAIVRLWSTLNDAAIEAVAEPGSRISTAKGGYFQVRRNTLFMGLPSGRELAYMMPELRPNKFGGQSVVYQGLGKNKQWTRIPTYGGLWAENMTQAVARDLLAEAMLRLDQERYHIVGHVHDEVILEEPEGQGCLQDVVKIMTKQPAWAKGLPIAADGFESEFYKK